MKMKNTMRLLAILLGCLLIFSSFGGSVLAFSPAIPKYASGNFVYEIERGGAKIVRIENPTSVVTIPCFLDEYPVVEITAGDERVTAFQVEKGHLFFKAINGVLYNRSVTKLIRVPCGFKGTLTIPEGVVEIADMAAAGCTKITAVQFPQSLRQIGDSSFRGCYKLKSISLPKNIVVMGDQSFWYCKALADISLPDGVRMFPNTFLGTAYYENPKNWDNGVLYIGNHLITAEKFTGGAYKIREGTRQIVREAFENVKGIEELVVPSSVEYIGLFAFNGLSMDAVKLPNKGIVMERCFGNQSAKEEIDKHIFKTQSLEKKGDVGYIPQGTLSLGQESICNESYCKTIYIPASVQAIAPNSFTKSNSVEGFAVDPENKYYTAVDGVLYTKDMKTLVCCPPEKSIVNIPQGVTKIAPYAFYENKRITKVEFPSTLKEIGNHAFWYCENLNVLNLPAGITYVGELAFNGCKALQKVTLPQKASIDFLALAKGGVLEVPYETQHIPFHESYQNGTVHLTNESFALEYAKALGIAYKVVKAAPKPAVPSKPETSAPALSKPIVQKQDKPIAPKDESVVSEVVDVLAPANPNGEPALVETPTDVPEDTPTHLSGGTNPWIWVGIALSVLVVAGGVAVPFVLKKRKNKIA